jgi:hypothetical protein
MRANAGLAVTVPLPITSKPAPTTTHHGRCRAGTRAAERGRQHRARVPKQAIAAYGHLQPRSPSRTLIHQKGCTRFHYGY